jgi:hypothetical protein
VYDRWLTDLVQIPSHMEQIKYAQEAKKKKKNTHTSHLHPIERLFANC